jgi:hypothetical protein
MGLIARFNMKASPKEVGAFIKKFGIPDENDGEWIPSGFPIGKVQSLEHLEDVRKQGLEKEMFYNISTGKYLKAGNNTMVYFEGYCVKRNTPEHHAILKVKTDEKEEGSEESITIDEKDGWEVVQGTNYIWSSKRMKIVGRLKEGKPIPLSQKSINAIKESSQLKWDRLTEDELNECRLT